MCLNGSGAAGRMVLVSKPFKSAGRWEVCPESKLDIPLCYDAFHEAGAVLGQRSGIVVFDDQTDMVKPRITT